MYYYRIDIELAAELDKKSAKELDKRFQLKLNDAQLLPQNSFVFISEASDDHLVIGGLKKNSQNIIEITSNILDSLCLTYKIIQISEITLSQLGSLVSAAPGEDGYVSKGIRKFNISDLVDIANGDYYHSSFEFRENLLEDGLTNEQLSKQASNQLFAQTFTDEIARIVQGQNVPVNGGHPVHYIVYADDNEVRTTLVQTLLQALYCNGRLSSKRYTNIELNVGSHYSHSLLKAFYEAANAGALVFEIEQSKNNSSQYASAQQSHIEDICNLLLQNKHEVLTVICCSLGNTSAKEIISSNCDGAVFIELAETSLRCSEARMFLKRLALEKGMLTDKRLYKGIPAKGDDGFLAADLRERFQTWFDARLLDTVYPQYAEVNTSFVRALAKPKGSAFTQMEELVGLQTVKSIIKQIIDYNRACALFQAKGFKNIRASMHMVFTGNPGTAKTTVARLFAQIMKDNGILARGNLIECGRADIVGKYVGWTAPTVKEIFDKAKGSVLFIDEAYSLLDDKEGMYGDEAINAIVQEMENCRENTVVILAGYPDKMEQFLRRNPGLESRIAHHIEFADYDSSELCAITELIVRSQQREMSGEVAPLLQKHYERARNRMDFGNGRYARNLVEQSIMRQASRLLALDPDDVTQKDVRLLTVGDFALDGASGAKVNGSASRCRERKVGFY